MSNTALALTNLAQLNAHSLAKALGVLNPAKMESDDLSSLLAEVHSAGTEIELFKIRAKRAMEACDPLDVQQPSDN